MSWLDWVIIILILLSLIRGFYTGFVRSLLGTLKYLVSFIVILFFGPQLGSFLTKPWNLTQTIALSIKDMVNMPGNLYEQAIHLTGLTQELNQGNFPVEEFSSSLKYIISNLELPQTLRDILTSLFQKENIIEYLLKAVPDFSAFPIKNMEELVFYTLGSFIAKLIAISIGALIIIISIFLISHFIIAIFEKIAKEDPVLNLTNRFIGAVFSGGISVLVLILVLELLTPLLCYFMIEPSQSMIFSIVLNTSFHIRPWLEHALLNM